MQIKIVWQKIKSLITRKKLFAFIIVAIILGILAIFFNDKFVDNFLTRYQEIEVKEFLQEDKDDPGWLKTFSPLVAPDGKFSDEGMVISGISPRTPGVIELLFNKAVSFDSFSPFFYGNLHSISSALPRDFIVYYLNEKDEWILIDEVRNNSSPSYQFHSKSKIFAGGIKIVLVSAYYNGSVWYKDLKFFEKQSVNLWEGIKYFVNEHRNGLPVYWIYYFIFFILLFLPGFVIISLFERQKKLSFDYDLEFIFSPIFSVVFMFLGTFFYLLSGVKVFLGFYLIIFAIAFVFFLKLRMYRYFFKSKMPLVFMTAALFVIFLTIAHRDFLFNMQYIGKYLDSLKPLPVGGYIGYFADNLFPWRIARVYLHRMPIFSPEAQKILGEATVFDRTPLLPMITAGILKIFGEGHFVYQRFIEVLGVLIYGAFFVLIKKYYSKKVAVISLLLMLINVPLSFMPFNAEYFYKYFSLYPILLAIILFITHKDSNKILVSVLAGLSFLIHPITLLYSSTVALLYFFRDKKILKFFKNIFPMSLILIFLFGIWVFSPRFLNLKEDDKITDISQRTFFRNMTMDGNLIINKVINLSMLLVPNILLKGINSEKISLFSREFRFEFLRYSLISNITPILFILFLIFVIKNIKKNREFVILAISPLLIYWLFYLHDYNVLFNYGGAYFHLYPFVVPFFLSYVVNRLSEKSKFINSIALGSYVVFMALNLYYISGNFTTIMKCASTTVYGLFWGIILMYVFLSFLLIKTVKNER